jgi:hypothetical protein
VGDIARFSQCSSACLRVAKISKDITMTTRQGYTMPACRSGDLFEESLADNAA